MLFELVADYATLKTFGISIILIGLVAPLETMIAFTRVEIIFVWILCNFGASLEEQITPPLESIIALIIHWTCFINSSIHVVCIVSGVSLEVQCF